MYIRNMCIQIHVNIMYLNYQFICIYTHTYTQIYRYTHRYICTCTHIIYDIHKYVCMYILTLFLSSLFLSHLFLFLSRSLSLARSVFLFLSSLPLSLAVSLQVMATWYLYVSRMRARFFCSSQTLSVFLSLSLFLSCSLALFFSFFCVHICTYQSWEACTQPHLSGFALGNSLASISATRSLRSLIPAAATTVNLPSFQRVCVERVQPSTTRDSHPEATVPYPHAQTRVTLAAVCSRSTVGGRAKKREGVGGMDALTRRDIWW